MMVTCPVCGDERPLGKDAVYRIRRGVRSGRCVSCANRKGPPAEKYLGTEWMRPEEREEPRAWARRVLLSMSERERRVFAEMELPDDDHSSYARPPERNRERESFNPYPYAKLEKPFGSDLKREAA